MILRVIVVCQIGELGMLIEYYTRIVIKSLPFAGSQGKRDSVQYEE